MASKCITHVHALKYTKLLKAKKKTDRGGRGPKVTNKADLDMPPTETEITTSIQLNQTKSKKRKDLMHLKKQMVVKLLFNSDHTLRHIKCVRLQE